MKGLLGKLEGKRLVLALLSPALLATLVLGIAAVQTRGEPAGFADGFGGGRLDSGVWEAGDHPLGRGALVPRNVSVEDNELRLALPAGSLDGGEVNTKRLQDHGSYRVRMRVPDSPGSITGFFLYSPPDYESEVDIEVYNDSSGRMLVTTYSGGDPEPTNSESVSLSFDPTEDFHDYGFDYGPEGVIFRVDGEPIQEFTSGLPERPMRLYINAWYPDWVVGGPPESEPDSDGALRVDRVESPGSVKGG